MRVHDFFGERRNFRARRANLDLIEIPVPIHKPFHANFDRRAGRVTRIARELGHIRVSVGNIAGLHRQQIFHSAFAEAILDDFDITREFDRLVIADVVDTVRCC